MIPELTIGFSPCPNDTFIFDGLINKKMPTDGFRFKPVLADVETLNNWAFEAKLPVTKLSYNTFLQVIDNYVLLDSGSALGNGVGPLLISKQKLPREVDLSTVIDKSKIAIPGRNTTANLLFSLAFPNAMNKTEVVFSEIEQGVLNGTFDFGLIIHENRFTYQEKGLEKWMDMGDWWERKSGAAIPLGGICVRRDIARDVALKLDRLIKESIGLSWKVYPVLSDFVRENAQEMEETVMRKHIELYVNEYTESLGVKGQKAIVTLFSLAERYGIIQAPRQPIFLKEEQVP